MLVLKARGTQFRPRAQREINREDAKDAKKNMEGRMNAGERE
jgi:hypothetical protein